VVKFCYIQEVFQRLISFGMQSFLRSAFIFLACWGVALGGTSTKNVVASRTASPPRIDGVLSDEKWNAAIPTAGFLQYDPDEGALPTEQTTVKVLYDDDALYVGIMCYDSIPSGIEQQLSRRDRTVQADRVSITIDSYHDHTTAYVFSGTVSGVQSDGVLSNDGRVYDIQWDAVWSFDARVVEGGWSAEFRIPYSALRFSDQDSEYVWGINFRRFIARKKETDEWVMVPRKETPQGTVASVSKMGHLSGIKQIHPSLHLEVLPYQVSKLNYFAQPSPFTTRSEFKETAGLDLKYGISNNLTFDLAVNPDFGQVEVDQSVLNLTVFETFYPEKRPFFLEGAQAFSFGTMFDTRQLYLFYSRRIGKKPAGYDTLTLPTNQAFADQPQATAILGAAKITGRMEGGLTIGALSAVTEPERAVLEDLAGNRSAPIDVEPRASYNVVRLRQEVMENSWVGFMATGSFKDRNLPALSSGVDWNIRFDDGAYALDGYVAGSDGVPNPLQAGASSHVTGSTGRIGFGKVAGEHWIAATTYDFASNNFTVNDLGFFSQPREQGGYTQVSYKEDRAAAPVLRYAMTVEEDYRWNWDGALTVSQFEFEPLWQFRNFWVLTLDYIHQFPAYDDANRGVLGLYHRPSGHQFSANLQTDDRRPVYLNLQSVYNTTTRGLGSWANTFSVNLRPTTWIELTPALTWQRIRNDEAWVFPVYVSDGTVSRNAFNLFGDRDLDEYDFALRGTFTLSRNVSLQFFTQILLAKGHYENFKRILNPDLLAPYDYPHYAGYSNPDFNEKTLNANIVLRWEYLPGSTLFLVWTQSRFGNNGMFSKPLSENFTDAFRLPMDNVFLAKLSYWWNR
jgi:hypothetical protein